MAFTLTKHAYTNYDTANPIDANNLNDIQDAIIDLEDNVVRSDLQALTGNQQAQARANIAAGRLYPINLSSGADLNNLNTPDDTGYYYIETGVTNAPSDWGGLIVIGRRNSACAQVAIYTRAIYIRLYTGSPLAWTAWRRIVSDDINESSLTLDSGLTGNTNIVKRTSNICEINLSVSSTDNFVKGQWVRIGVVPSGYRPPNNVYVMGIDNTNGLPVETRITAAGAFSIWAKSSNPDFKLFAALVTYIVDNQ